MNKSLIILIMLLSLTIITNASAIALEIVGTTELKNTSIDYTPYRELVINKPEVVYLIKITNTGAVDKTYEIIPDSEVVERIGTYRIDPSSAITVKPGREETIYIYLSVEKRVSSRTIIPVKIKSGATEKNIELVARPIGPQMPEKPRTDMLTAVFKIIVSVILAIMIILAIVFAFRKMRKKKAEETEEELNPELNEDEEVESYY